MDVVIYHNPRCTKSRETLKLLQARGIEPKIVEYLKTPPSKSELENILRLLRMEPRDLMRKQEPEYKEANLDDPGLTRETLIRARSSGPG